MQARVKPSACASRSTASPTILLLLRITQRELTLCEHKASHPETTAPRFSPDAQRIYFQSDRDGKPAIYCVHVERLVERIDAESRAAKRGLLSIPAFGIG